MFLTLFFVSLLFLVSHVLHWLLIFIIRLFMVYVFYFLFCEIKKKKKKKEKGSKMCFAFFLDLKSRLANLSLHNMFMYLV